MYIQPIALAKKQSLRISRECFGRRARLLNRVVTRIFDEELRPFEIKVNQYTILVALSLRGGIRAAELAKRLEVEKSSLSRNLGTMSELGWIVQDEGVELTSAGERLLAKAYPAWNRAQARVAERLGDTGADGLCEATDPLLE